VERQGSLRVVSILTAAFRPGPIAALLLSGLLIVAALAGWLLLRLPLDGGMIEEAPSASVVLEATDGEPFASRGVFRGTALTPDNLPRWLKDAVISIEDQRFYEHGGIDLRGLLRAALRNAVAGRAREGGSTITQQLARLLYLSQERSLTRKGQELLIALWLEHQLSKDQIVARYLSSAYFGAGAWGADAAARRYFGKEPGTLTLAEAAMLAGLVQAPSHLAPTRNLSGAQRRAGTVLDAMLNAGRLTAEEAAAARAAPAELRTPPEAMPGRGYFADWAEGETRRLAGSLPADARARTTLDLSLQDIAERVVMQALDREGEHAKVGQAALVAMSHDGAILAVVGGRDYQASQFNRVNQARRQPGSLFKLFVYGAALEAGWAPSTSVVDRPVRVGAWEPVNFDRTYRGQMTLRDAFSRSVNTVAVQLSEAVGRDRVIEFAQRLGVQSDLLNVPSIALGSVETTLLDMTTAFASVAAGRRVEPYLVREVRARDRSLFTHLPPTAASVLQPSTQAALLELLLSSVREGTGRAAQLARPVAGKTGTTQDSRDAWFIGFTADVVVGVWVGNDNSSPTNGVAGGGMPAVMWRSFVAEADRVKTANVRASAGAHASSSASVPPAPAPALSLPSASRPDHARMREPIVVLDTATLRIGQDLVRLAGVEGFTGQAADQMARYLVGRDVICEAPDASGHRCRVGDRDLAEVVLSNGGGRAAATAPPLLRRAENDARRARLGIWAAPGRSVSGTPP